MTRKNENNDRLFHYEYIGVQNFKLNRNVKMDQNWMTRFDPDNPINGKTK